MINHIKILFIAVIISALIGCGEGSNSNNDTKQPVSPQQNTEETEKIAEQIRLAKERLERKLEGERLEKERLEKERLEKERLEKKKQIFSFSKYIKNKNDFIFLSKGGRKNQDFYTLTSEPGAKYLVKSIKEKPDVLADFVGAFILRKIIGDRAPVNYIVCDENGEIVGLASRLIENFVSIHDYMINTKISSDPRFMQAKEKTKTINDYLHYFLIGTLTDNLLPRCKNIEEICEELCYSNNIVEVNLLANFINQLDYHHGNVGFIVKGGKIINSALVDFSYSLDFSAGPWQKVQPSNRYFSGIAKALVSLNLIRSKFQVSSLNELNDLFNCLGEDSELKRVKTLMQNNLTNIEKQIDVCNRLTKIITGSYTEIEFDELINIGKTPSLGIGESILMNFTSQNGENILINYLCQKNDLDHLIKTLSADKKLISACINYCLTNNLHGLLDKLILQLTLDKKASENLAQETLKSHNTIEHLIIYLKLIKKTGVQYSDIDAEKLIQNALNSRTVEHQAEFLKLIKEIGSTGAYLKNNSINIDNQIKFCELLAKVINDSYKEEEFEELISIGKNRTMRKKEVYYYMDSPIDESIFTDFTSENGENILINYLCQKNDLDHLIKTLSADKKLISACINYCLANNLHGLLINLIEHLDKESKEELIQKTLEGCKTTECLKTCLELMKKINLDSDHISLIEDYLSNKLSYDNLVEKFYDLLKQKKAYKKDVHTSSYGVTSYTYTPYIYTQILNALITLELLQDNSSPLDKQSSLDVLDNKDEYNTFVNAVYDKFFNSRPKDIDGIRKWIAWSNDDNIGDKIVYLFAITHEYVFLKNLLDGYSKASLEKFVNSAKLYDEEKKKLYKMLGV